MPGALDGIRVVDFGQYVAGPVAAMLLGDQGADVIRVDPPAGPSWRTPANATWNRNKRSIDLDLKSATDLEVARGLVASADVVVENFRPGVMERLGLGAAEMTTTNPGLVYCSLPGFGSDDPRAQVRAWEGVVGAATRTYPRNPRTGRPVYNVLPFSSMYAAFLGATYVAMALNARERDGLGQVIEVPLFDATFAAIGFHGLRVHNAADGGGIAALARMLGWTRQFRCKDGRWFMYHAGNLNAPEFFRATGAADWMASDQWDQLAAEEQQERIASLFLERTAAEWEAFCEQVGTEGAVCRTTAEWLEDPGARESGIVVETVDPELGEGPGPGLNVRMSATPGSIRSPRPTLDADREAVLSELGPAASMESASQAGSRRPALEGLRVLDLCIILAGPTCGRTLGEFGADVIKIDSPSRAAVAFHNDINRAKRSIVLDLKSPEGLEVFWKLGDTADVVVQNFRKGVAERLGIGYEQVRARKPDIVYASLNTYGQQGRYSGRPGHEQIAQAATGMQERYGGDRPALAPFAVNDYGTGLMGAYAVALALWHRQRTGEGQHVDTALAFTATMLQSSLLPAFAGKAWDEPRGAEALGSGPLNRLYEAGDGWLFVAGRRADLGGRPDFAGMADCDDAALAEALAERLRRMSVDDGVAALTRAGVGAHRVVEEFRELMDDPWVRAHGLSVTREHDGFGPVTTTGPSARLSGTPPEPGRPAPRPGADAREILAEVGMAEALEGLVQRGVVRIEGIGAR